MSNSWEPWIKSHGPQLVLFAKRWATDHAEAEDLVQEAFARFWRNRSQAADPLTYIYSCVRNVATEWHRSRISRQERERKSSNPNEAASQFSSTLERDERRMEIEKALLRLPVEQAEIVTLKIWSELTFAQIAEVTQAPLGSVASRYRYAIKHLRTLLNESNSNE